MGFGVGCKIDGRENAELLKSNFVRNQYKILPEIYGNHTSCR